MSYRFNPKDKFCLSQNYAAGKCDYLCMFNKTCKYYLEERYKTFIDKQGDK